MTSNQETCYYEIIVSKGSTFDNTSFDNIWDGNNLTGNAYTDHTNQDNEYLNPPGAYDVNNGIYSFNTNKKFIDYAFDTNHREYTGGALHVRKINLKNTFSFGFIQYDYVFVTTCGSLFWLKDSDDANTVYKDFNAAKNANVPMISFLGHSRK